MSVLYSICITSRGNDELIERSLGSLFSQIDDRFEVIIADDGGGPRRAEYLARLEAEGKIRRLITRRVTRGRGRQVAHEAARGSYELSMIDTDDILKPGAIAPLLDLYHRKVEGRFLVSKALSIAPRKLVDELGGYDDINMGEDDNLWFRAFLRGHYVELLSYDIVEVRANDVHSLRTRLGSRYARSRDKFRMGVNPITLYQKERNPIRLLPIFVAAWVDAKLKGEITHKISTSDFIFYLNKRGEADLGREFGSEGFLHG